MRRFTLRAACLGLLALTAPAFAENLKPAVTKLDAPARSYLFVGNSFYYYNNSMHSYFLDIARAADPAHAKDYRGVSATISGSGLNWHDMEGYFNKGMASYSFDDDNNVVPNSFDKPFDVVVMNDCSQCPINPSLSGLFKEYVKKHGDTVRAHGAVPVLFMTWAYENKPEMTGQLAEAYTAEGNANDMLVIPAGLAFARALKLDPTLVMYQKDKRHPSPLGTYLSAATTYAALYGKSPEGNVATHGIEPRTAALLDKAAWDTVRDYFGRPGSTLTR